MQPINIKCTSLNKLLGIYISLCILKNSLDHYFYDTCPFCTPIFALFRLSKIKTTYVQ
jgi:hypothetical protein